MFNEDWKCEFLSRTGWADAVETRAGEDWALRKFSRLTKNNQTVILMQSLLDTDPRATLGHKIADYVRIAKYLKSENFPLPEIIAEDVDHGLLLIEDFGDMSLHELVVAKSDDVASMYLKSTELLLRFYKEIQSNEAELPNYFDTAIYKGRQRIIDWYYPAVTGTPASSELREEYLGIWREIENRLPKPVFKFSHADYHPHNLMVRHDGEIGLIDFQGAMWAPAPYDLVNLLEDARRIVPEEIKIACLNIFRDNLTEDEWDNFSKWYVVLSAQFHARVIGQAVRLAVKEGQNAPSRLCAKS